MNSLDAGSHLNTQMTNPEEAVAQKKNINKEINPRGGSWLSG
jgi:hypothetical protein